MTLKQPLSSDTIRVLIAEDNGDLRMAIRLLLDGEPDLRCVAETGNLDNIAQLSEEFQADVVLLDIELQGKSSLQILKTLQRQQPKTRFLIHSGHAHADIQRLAISSGASGFVVKSGDTLELLTAIRSVMMHIPIYSARTG